jgi:hypothetical protein
MRIALTFCTILFLSVTLLFWLREEPETGLEVMVPHDVLGLVILNNMPPNLDFLDRLPLDHWVDIEADRLREKIPEGVREELSALMRTDLKSIWIIVHHLDHRPEGAWRIHFSALLIPKPLRLEVLEMKTQSAALRLFGSEETVMVERENITFYRGARPGQVLYQVRMPKFLVVSNSGEALPQLLETLFGRRASLADNASFQRIKTRLRTSQGAFVYFNARRILPIFPEVGYSLRWEGQRVYDQFYQAK